MSARVTVAILAAAILCAAPATSAQTLYDRLVGVVSGYPITRFDVERTATLPELGPALLGLAPRLPERRSWDWAVEQTITDELALQAARELGVEASMDQVVMHLEELKRQNGWDDAQFLEALNALGFRSVSAARRAFRRVMSIGQVMRVKVGSRVTVNEKEVAELFRRAHGDGTEPEVKLRQILVRVPLIVRPEVEVEMLAHLEGVRARIVAGELSFEDAARQFSDSPERADGGDLGWTRRGTYPFDAPAFSLEPGAVSSVSRSYLGFHIMRVDARRRVPLTSEERLRRVLMQDVYEERFARELAGWRRELRDAAVVRILPEEPLFPFAGPPAS